ncbi:endonuclease domain-containing protein [Brachybacterium sp. AOP29-B2-41]|uniref:endonuclease domain-containing protein n=2 Tax=Brachybacterium TaxID=43668 RepID=UPI003FE02EB0
MYGPSRLILPASAGPPFRPNRRRRGTLHLTARQLGIARRSELVVFGLTPWTMRAALERGELQRVARGWIARPSASPDVIRALIAGFRLTCVDAARLHGLWTPDDTPAEEHLLHVYRYGDERAVPDGMITHLPRVRSWPEQDAVASVSLTLEHALRCCSGETAAVLLESAMERRLLSPAAVQQLLDDAPDAVRSRIGTLSAASDSGSETRVARWLRRRHFQVEQQVFVDGVGLLDAYVGGLFLEIDGREFHDGEDAFSRDRRRDLRAIRHGLQVLRLSYAQVWHDWERTQQDILRAIDEVGAFGRRKVEQLALR